MENKDDRGKFAEAVREIDWNTITFDMFAAVPFDEKKAGPAFSPAFNSLWMIYAGNEHEHHPTLKLWFIQAALADGTPTAGYFGLNFDTPIVSRCGSKFPPFAHENNIYRVVVKNNPLTIKIESFHHEHDPQMVHPYITVTCVFQPAEIEEISKIVGDIGAEDMCHTQIKNTAAMIVKGAIVEETLSAYYPNASNGQLFAIMDDPEKYQKHISDEVGSGTSHEDAGGSIPLSMNKAIVGNLLGAFNFFFANRDGIWVLPPTIEDTEIDVNKCDRNDVVSRQEVARKNLLMHVKSAL